MVVAANSSASPVQETMARMGKAMKSKKKKGWRNSFPAGGLLQNVGQLTSLIPIICFFCWLSYMDGILTARPIRHSKQFIQKLQEAA